MSDITPPAVSAGAHPNPTGGEVGLQVGHLNRRQITSLALASFIPAAGFSLAPFLFFTYGGFNAWPAALLAMLATICVGLALTTFARRYVGTGSLYSYIGEAFGPWARYLVAAGLLLGFVAQMGGIGSVVSIYFGSFLSSVGLDGATSPGASLTILAVALLIAAFVASRGLDTSVHVAVALTALSLPLVLLITIASASRTGLDLSHQFDFGALSMSATFQGMAAGVAWLVGFESCSALAAETRDPKRNVPVAVMSVPIILGLLYLGATFLQVPGLAQSAEALGAGASPPAALAGVGGLPSWVGTAGDLVLAVATFAALVGFANFGSRYLVSLAVDRLMPARVARLHPRRQSPVTAIVALSTMGFALMAAVTLAAGAILTAYSAFSVVIVYSWVPPYLLITAGAIRLMVRERAVRPAVLVASILGFAAMAWLYINGLIHPPASPADTMSWVVVVAIAALTIIFAIAGSRRSPARSGVPAEAGADV